MFFSPRRVWPGEGRRRRRRRTGKSGTGDILWVPGGEHGERDFPKVTVPLLDPDNRKKGVVTGETAG